jgi:hypothetical protein
MLFFYIKSLFCVSFLNRLFLKYYHIYLCEILVVFLMKNDQINIRNKLYKPMCFKYIVKYLNKQIK